MSKWNILKKGALIAGYAAARYGLTNNPTNAYKTIFNDKQKFPRTSTVVKEQPGWLVEQNNKLTFFGIDGSVKVDPDGIKGSKPWENKLPPGSIEDAIKEGKANASGQTISSLDKPIQKGNIFSNTAGIVSSAGKNARKIIDKGNIFLNPALLGASVAQQYNNAGKSIDVQEPIKKR